ncbi:MAG: putative polysaccharide transporter [Nitrososphaeraceae archaeon]|jgi:O-antigen/teichoic acid export membrane protein|nr:putative polysaccharide transporter [Nitrososphaeraceae archaeon]MDF2767466.1 putative polysaccharide transporter [Nitrososphaeraceae archaeon]
MRLRFLSSHKGLIYITLGNLLGAAATGAFWLLLALIQNADEYGKTNYEISIASLAASAALLGLNTTVTTYVAKGSSKINVQANQLILISSGIAAIIVAFFNWILGFFVIGMAFWMMSTYELLGRKMYKQYAFVNIGARASQLFLSILLYYFIGITGIAIGFIISFLIFSQRYFISTKEFSRDFSEVKSKIKFSLNIYSFNMSNAFLLYFDKLIIAPLFGYAVLGYYQLGFQFLLFLGMIPISFYQYLIPEESSGLKKTRVRFLGLLVSIGLTAILFLSSPWILQNLFPHYMASLNAMRIMSIGIIPMMIVWTLNSKFLNLGDTKYVLFGSAIYLTLQIGLIFYLGSTMNVIGLALAVVLALIAQASFLFISDKHLQQKHKKDTP